MTLRTVKAGKRKYKPGHGLKIKRNRYGFRLDYEIPASAWYPPKTNAAGNNSEQWNKLGGTSFFNLYPTTWFPNSCSAFVGIRPAIQEGYFELCAYVNKRFTVLQLIKAIFRQRAKNWFYEPLLNVQAGTKGTVNVVGTRGPWYFDNLHGNGQHRGTNVPVDVAFWQHNVGPWFGGSDRAKHTHSVKTDIR